MKSPLTTLCYMEKDGKYLMLYRNKKENDVNEGKWIGIGGHFEEGESPDECLLREVYEETGLTIENPRLCGVKEWENSDGSRYIVLLYKTDRFSGKIRSSHEGKVCWAALSSLPSLQLSLDFEKLLEVFLRDDLSEFYFEQTPEGWQDHLL